MNTPSVAFGAHDRYTPEVRDRILEKLSSAMDRTAFAMLTPAHLRALAAIESPGAPVLSVYLQLTPERRSREAWRSVFANLVDVTLRRIAGKKEREAVRNEFQRIEDALNAELPALGRGVAFFTCQSLGLWRQIAVSVALPDGAYLRSRPHLRPLVRTRDEHDRFVLVLLGQERTRYFISQIGQVEEVFTVKGARLSRMFPEHAGRERGDDLKLEAAKKEARVRARVAELVLAQFEGRYLLLSGSLALRSAFIESLPKDLQRNVGGEFSVDIHASPVEIAAAAEPAQRAIEEREELATVRRLIDASPNVTVWNVCPTLDALCTQRVATLAVDDTFGQPGVRCGDCSSLFEALSGNCPSCGGDTIDTVDDIVELAIEQALEQRAAVEMVRSPSARRLMAERGPMAVLLRSY